jgi:hypothetical protein
MIEKKQLPVAPAKGLYLDGVTVPGGLSKAENVIILEDGTFERRAFERTFAESPACLAGRGLKTIYELNKTGGTRYIFADVDVSDSVISSLGNELIANFAGWTDPGAAWGYAATKWTHVSGTTPLVATGETAVVATTKYRVVADVTCPAPAATGGGWAYTQVDSGQTWVSSSGTSHKIWIDTWTHTASGGTAALTTINDFTPVIGATYRIKVHVTHTSGTSLTVAIGGKTAGVITATGVYTYTVPFITTAAALTFTPTNDWAGTVTKSWPYAPSKVDDHISVMKFKVASGINVPSNLGPELIHDKINNWYPEAAASSGQSISVYIGNTLGGTITASGEYSYDITATDTSALTFTPTTAWGGSVNSASVKAITESVDSTKMKTLAGTVTGTDDYETSWGTVLTDLTAVDTTPQWATLQDRAFRVDGTNLNCWFSNATTAHYLGVPTPVDAPVTANATTTGGGITAGSYNVYYTYVKKLDSDTYVVEGNPSPVSNVTVTGNSITVNVIGNTDGGTVLTTEVTHIRIYRTLYNEPGSDAYLDQEVNNATATITLIQADDYIGDGAVLEFDHDAPPIGKYVMGAGSRLWLIDADGILHWSILDQPELFPALQIQSFDPKDGDAVTGMCALKGYILVFKRRRTWMMNMFSADVSDSGIASLAKDVISSKLGCISTGSIQSVGSDSAIWLSAAGFILYDGGTFKNISAGDPNTGVPSRIQSVIDSFVINGAENYITSAFHSSKQLYHVNLIYKNDAGTSITSQRHFVYNLKNDTWTEYVYESDAGVKYYETNIAIAHDSLGNEVVLNPYLVSGSSVTINIHQSEYDTSIIPSVATNILSTGGVGVTDLGSNPLGGVYTFNDSSNSTYVVGYRGQTFKVTSANVATVLVSDANIAARSWPAATSGGTVRVMNFISNAANSRMFTQLRCAYSNGKTAHGVFKVSTAGVMVDLSMDTISGSYVHTKFIGADSSVTKLYVLTWDNYMQSAAPTYFRLSEMDVTTGALTTLYNFTGITAALALAYDKLPFVINDDDLYYYYAGNLYVLTDFDGTPSLASHATGITSTVVPVDLYIDSETKLYLFVRGDYFANQDLTLCVGTFENSAWSFEGSPYSGLQDGTNYHSTTNWDSRHYMIHKNTKGQFIIEGIANYPGFMVYEPNWDLAGRIFPNAEWPYGAGDCIGISWWSTDETVFIGCGGQNETTGVWRLVTYGFAGTVADIVSNYFDLGIAEDKRISRAYVDTVSKYITKGTFALEPGYNINETTHVDDEAAEPSGSVSRLNFYHKGEMTWNTGSTFDSTVEQWRSHRIDVGTKGQMFRYSIQIGDIAGGYHGYCRIRPPKLMVQILNKP